MDQGNGSRLWGGWPTGHNGWIFDGRHDFEGGSTSFLAEGVARDERLVVISDDPKPHLWPRGLQERGVLTVTSTREAYGHDLFVEPAIQRELFAAAMADALANGYSGLRVVSGNTSLVAGADRLTAWLAWEAVADELAAENPYTALCCFDRTRIDRATLSAVRDAHHAEAS